MVNNSTRVMKRWLITITLLVQAQGCQISKSPEKTAFSPGDRAQIKCSMDKDSMNRVKEIDWFKRKGSQKSETMASFLYKNAGQTIEPKSSVSTDRLNVTVGRNWTLLSIYSLTPEDEADYTCQFHLIDESHPCLQRFSLTVTVSESTIGMEHEAPTAVGANYVLASAAGAIISIVITTAVYYVYRYYQARKRSRRSLDQDPEDEELRRLEPPAHDASNHAGTANTSSETVAGEISIQALQFDRSCKLGEGQFGEVWKGYMEVEEKVKTVAVKILKGNTMYKEKEDFKTEMETLKNVPAHKNIVPLIATSSKEDPLFIVMEYQTMGSLQRVLRNGRGNTYYSNTYGCSKFTAQQLLTFAYEVACGMTHIAELGYLHRDLATRNVLVDEHFTCKISDFGLARDVSLIREYESRSQGFLPLRWMALESIKDSVYTTHSDVWSFGILMWEIVTLGCTPYPGISSMILRQQLENGYRMMRPKHCTYEVYRIMYRCWREPPAFRPSFKELCQQLEDLISKAQNYVDLVNIDERLFKGLTRCIPGEKY